MADLTIDQRELLYSITAGLPMAAPSEVWDSLIAAGLIEREMHKMGTQFRATEYGASVLGVRPE